MRLTLIRFGILVVFAAGIFTQNQSAAQDSPTSPANTQNSAKMVRMGNVIMEANLIKKVQPVYPSAALAAKVSGIVVLHVTIGVDGKVQNLQFVSGPPLLIRAAMDAVQQWEYEPVRLNGELVRVDTTISVAFVLRQNTASGDDSSQSRPQTPPASDAASTQSTIDAQFRADAVQMLDLMHYRQAAREAMNQLSSTVRPQLIAAFPSTPNRDKIVDTYLSRLMDIPDSPEFTNALIQTIAQYLSDDDLKGLIAFYQTPVGQHYAAVNVPLADTGTNLGKSRGAQILVELCKEYPELQGKTEFCPAKPQNESSLRRLGISAYSGM